MKTCRLTLLRTIITTAFLLLPSLASAAGLWLYEMGIPDNFMAAAGRAALASDASTAGTTPAGMILLERSELFIGFAGLDVHAEFDISSTTNDGGDGGRAGSFTPVGSLAYVHKISPTGVSGLAPPPILVSASTLMMNGPDATILMRQTL